MTRNLSRRNLTILIIIAAVFAASVLLLNNKPDKMADNQSISPSEIVSDIERSLIALQTKQIDMNEFKSKTGAYFHKYYAESFFKGYENAMPMVIFAINTTSPQDIQISIPYMNSQGDRQTVLVKIIDPEIPTSLVVKNYTFAKEGNAWKILQVAQNLAYTKDDRYKELLRRYAEINGKPIEYHNLEMK